ncbi:hypothetical protein DMENIID0001_007540 [Sergentomyia squamirostris]
MLDDPKVFNENLPKLIKELTAFDEKDKNFKLCQDFAKARISRFDVSYVCTAEVRRKIDGIAERLEVENLQEYADMLRGDFKQLINKPDGEEYMDTHKNWKMLEFLLVLMKNPISGAKALRILKEAQIEIPQDIQVDLVPEEPVNVKKFEWRNQEESDLSEWSESEEEVSNPIETNEQDVKLFLRYLPGDAPEHHRSQSNSDSTDDSDESESTTSALSDRVPFSLLHCPIREVIWMFFHPDNCNFYCIEGDTVYLREDVDLPNVIVFRKFMEDFTQPMSIVLRLRRFCRRVLTSEGSPPQAYFIYAEALRDLLRPLEEYLLEMEKKITPETMNEPATLLNFCHALEPHFLILKHLIKIHESCVVDWKYYPRHICSAFLQAKIFQFIQKGLNRVEVNVAASLFVSVLQFYLQVIHSWWCFGHISDQQKEFIVKDRNPDCGVIFRAFQLDGGKCTELESEMNSLLENCPILKLLKSHCEKIEERLDAICALNRTGNYRMKTTSSLCRDFLEKFTVSLEDFLTPESSDTSRASSVSRDYVDFRKQLLSGKLILHLFEKSISKSTQSHSTINFVLRNLLDRSKGMLPLERIITKALNDTLNTEIHASDRVMVEIYTKELDLFKHFQLIRKVFLLEDSATMFTFYTRLFDEIETRQDVIHPLSLTVNLQNALSSQYPGSHSNFRLEVASLHNCKTDSVLEVIRQVSLIYKMTPNIARVYDESSMRSYNRLFVFLLSIKWSVWTLESLKFTKSSTDPYALLTEQLRNTRRLSIIRFWILYAINNIHCHLMSEALERLGNEVEQKIKAAESLQDIINTHNDYLETLLEHCFLKRDGEKIITGINQLFHLVQVIRSEWVALDKGYTSDDEQSFEIEPQIDQIEKTYAECHRFLANTLNQEVAINGKTYLSGLVSAFDRRIPY